MAMNKSLQKKLELIRIKKETKRLKEIEQNKKIKAREQQILKQIKNEEKKKLKRLESQITEIGYYLVQNYKSMTLPTELIDKINTIINSKNQTAEEEILTVEEEDFINALDKAEVIQNVATEL